MGLEGDCPDASKTFGDVWRHFWFFRLGGATDNCWGEDRETSKHPTMHKTIPHNKELL